MILELHIAHDLVVIDGIGRAAKDTHKRKPLHEFQEQHVYRKSTSCLLDLGLQLILASLRHLLDHAIHPCILHSKIRAFGKSCFHHAKDKKPLLWSIIGKAIAQGGFINTFKQHTDKHHDIRQANAQCPKADSFHSCQGGVCQTRPTGISLDLFQFLSATLDLDGIILNGMGLFKILTVVGFFNDPDALMKAVSKLR